MLDLEIPADEAERLRTVGKLVANYYDKLTENMTGENARHLCQGLQAHLLAYFFPLAPVTAFRPATPGEKVDADL